MKIKSKSKVIYEYVLLILMGMFCFSSLGTKIAQDYLHLPISMPELFFIPLFALLRKKFKPIQFDKDTFVGLVLLLILLVVWGVIWGQFPVYSILSASRSYLYLFLFFCIFKKNTHYDDDVIITICFGSIIGWFITTSFGFQQMAIDNSETVQSNGNMISVAIFILYTILQKRWGLFFLGMLLILYICVFAGIRRVILVTAVSFALAVIIQVLYSKMSIIKQVIIVGLVVVPVTVALPLVDEAVEEMNPLLHYRIFGKSESMLRGESSTSDDLRKDNMRKFIDHPEEHLFSKGMVSYQFFTDKDTGIFMDFPLTALSHMFGLPIAIIIVVFFMIKSIETFRFYRKQKVVAAGVYAAMGGVFFMLLFVEGSFLAHPFTSPLTGMCLGRVVYYSRQKAILRESFMQPNIGY